MLKLTKDYIIPTYKSCVKSYLEVTGATAKSLRHVETPFLTMPGGGDTPPDPDKARGLRGTIRHCLFSTDEATLRCTTRTVGSVESDRDHFLENNQVDSFLRQGAAPAHVLREL